MTEKQINIPTEETDEEQVKTSAVRKWIPVAASAGIGFTLAIVFGGLLFFLVGPSKPDAQSAEAQTVPPPIDPLREMLMGDKLLQAGRIQEAINRYEMAKTTGTAPVSPLNYRIGICQEWSNNLDAAYDAYADSDTNMQTEQDLAANLSKARILHRKGQPIEAVRVLSNMAAESAMPVYSSTRVGQDIDYALAFMRSSWALSELPTSLMHNDHVFRQPSRVSITRLLSLNPIEGNQIQQLTPVGDDRRLGIRITGRVGRPEMTLVSIGIENQTVSVVLETLARATGWKIAATDASAEIASARRIDLYVKDKTAAEVLALALEPIQLFWRFDDNNVIIEEAANVDPRTQRAQQAKLAADALSNALTDAPNHWLAGDAYITLGNISFMQGKHDRAKAHYREAIEKFPRMLSTQYAQYNLAKTNLKKRIHDEAIENFLDVVDARIDAGLDPVSLAFLGRIYLDSGDLKRSKQYFSRAMALAQRPAVAATASLSLAGVYLMERDSEQTIGSAIAANQVLMEQRKALRTDLFRDKAVFLSALTRYRAAINSSDLNRRKNELISAAIKVDPASFFCEFGFLLKGDALADVSITTEAVVSYQNGLSRISSLQIRDELLFRVANEYRKQNRLELAEQSLLELAATESKHWAPKASLALARMYLQQGNLAACADHCRWAIRQGFDEDANKALLEVLGKVYEELGQHKLAAHCFAGFLPRASTAEENLR